MGHVTRRQTVFVAGEHRSVWPWGKASTLTPKMLGDIVRLWGKNGRPVRLRRDPTHSVFYELVRKMFGKPNKLDSLPAERFKTPGNADNPRLLDAAGAELDPSKPEQVARAATIDADLTFKSQAAADDWADFGSLSPEYLKGPDGWFVFQVVPTSVPKQVGAEAAADVVDLADLQGIDWSSLKSGDIMAAIDGVDAMADSQLGARIRSLMEDKEITVEELAEAAGRDASTISSILSGDIEAPAAEVLAAIAGRLDVSVDSLRNEIPEDDRERSEAMSDLPQELIDRLPEGDDLEARIRALIDGNDVLKVKADKFDVITERLGGSGSGAGNAGALVDLGIDGDLSVEDQIAALADIVKSEREDRRNVRAVSRLNLWRAEGRISPGQAESDRWAERARNLDEDAWGALADDFPVDKYPREIISGADEATTTGDGEADTLWTEAKALLGTKAKDGSTIRSLADVARADDRFKPLLNEVG